MLSLLLVAVVIAASVLNENDKTRWVRLKYLKICFFFEVII